MHLEGLTWQLGSGGMWGTRVNPEKRGWESLLGKRMGALRWSAAVSF